ncbi:MAG: D-glycero-beta-D-manno-heptose-7-phosphate kinase [Candidatus Syntrophosphaera sp.]
MIREILKEFTGKRILVLGDVMLDHYVWGNVERISPEAPVPVLEAQSEEIRLGGAANVALNIRSLGAEALLLGVIGEDPPADTMKKLLKEKGIGGGYLVPDPDRSTTLKTRIGAVNQQILRIDYESKTDIREKVIDRVLDWLGKLLPDCDALIIEDYNKGLLTKDLIRATLEIARINKVPVAVDPKLQNFLAYGGVEILKPNYKEIQSVLATSFRDDNEFFEAALRLRREMQVKNLIVTRGNLGMYIFDDDGKPMHLPTVARQVYDVSGAGDTVISALTLAYASGADIKLATELANHAAGVVCGIKGTASVSPEEIIASYDEQQ